MDELEKTETVLIIISVLILLAYSAYLVSTTIGV